MFTKIKIAYQNWFRKFVVKHYKLKTKKKMIIKTLEKMNDKDLDRIIKQNQMAFGKEKVHLYKREVKIKKLSSLIDMLEERDINKILSMA